MWQCMGMGSKRCGQCVGTVLKISGRFQLYPPACSCDYIPVFLSACLPVCPVASLPYLLVCLYFPRAFVLYISYRYHAHTIPTLFWHRAHTLPISLHHAHTLFPLYPRIMYVLRFAILIRFAHNMPTLLRHTNNSQTPLTQCPHGVHTGSTPCSHRIQPHSTHNQMAGLRVDLASPDRFHFHKTRLFCLWL